MVQSGQYNPNDETHRYVETFNISRWHGDGYEIVAIIYRHCVAFVYLPFLKEDLSNFVERWNDHRIRPSKTSGCPSGVPNDLYHLPEINRKSSIFMNIISVQCHVLSFWQVHKTTSIHSIYPFGKKVSLSMPDSLIPSTLLNLKQLLCTYLATWASQDPPSRDKMLCMFTWF